MSSRAVGLEGARVRLPSGRWLDEIADPAQATANEVAWVVARTMFSHADGERFYGNIEFALSLAWDKTVLPEAKRKHMVKGLRIASALRRNGFMHQQQNSKNRGERFFWLVPSVFPVWDGNGSGSPIDDDGSQTTGGSVSKHRITPQMNILMSAIERDPARHRRDYAQVLGWAPSNVTSVARTLVKFGYVEMRGNRVSSRYYPTGKPFPHIKVDPDVILVPGGGRKPDGERASERVAIIKQAKAATERDPVATRISQNIEGTNEQEIVYDLPAGLYMVVNGKIEKFTPKYKVVTL